jgi:hypothetical protein
LVTHFLQEFRCNVHYAQLGHILYVGLERKTLKRVALYVAESQLESIALSPSLASNQEPRIA